MRKYYNTLVNWYYYEYVNKHCNQYHMTRRCFRLSKQTIINLHYKKWSKFFVYYNLWRSREINKFIVYTAYWPRITHCWSEVVIKMLCLSINVSDHYIMNHQVNNNRVDIYMSYVQWDLTYIFDLKKKIGIESDLR